MASHMHGEAQLLPNHRLNRSSSASSPVRGWHEAVPAGACSPAPPLVRACSPAPQHFQTILLTGPQPAIMPLPHAGPNPLLVSMPPPLAPLTAAP
eukprot:CAMPEP_0172753222 /NCGR_PEP_ID=MMETSP1074-20121228/155503_1 /TAXON_ID=2916 /ORGANISM="Ceratium fusus, Strain PA161109" /LENGTH=94 /DNA_ID=CAMNT_0013585849 /DNA_START=20 /DNA_END=300 /DNA_ORIENTATION=-